MKGSGWPVDLTSDGFADGRGDCVLHGLRMDDEVVGRRILPGAAFAGVDAADEAVAMLAGDLQEGGLLELAMTTNGFDWKQLPH